jgi:membrane protease YdiL (CAAX protease family)
MQTEARRSLLALLLLVPAPTIGSAVLMLVPATRDTVPGAVIFGLAKAWLLAFPLIWLLFVERKPISFSPARKGGLWVGAGLGLLISAVIYATFLLIQSTLIDPAELREYVAGKGLDKIGNYLLAAVAVCGVNAVLEEYVWRWFVFRRCEDLMPKFVAVLASAAMFTAHHVVVLTAQFDWPIVLLGSSGVFIGGAVWSWCYLKYRSIWPGYVSHVLVDIMIFVIGYRLIFA